MLRLLLICLLFVFPSFRYSIDNSSQRKKEKGWLIFKESGGVLFAQDSLPEPIRSGNFFNKYQYLKGIDVSNNGSIYEFERYATTYEALFWGNKNKEGIRILPVQVEIYSRKKSFNPEQNAWAFKRAKDSTIILYNTPDTVYVSNIVLTKRRQAIATKHRFVQNNVGYNPRTVKPGKPGFTVISFYLFMNFSMMASFSLSMRS